MKVATALALVLAILLGVVSLSYFGDLAGDIQAVLAAGPLNDFVGFWSFIVMLLVLGVAAAFAIGAASSRRR